MFVHPLRWCLDRPMDSFIFRLRPSAAALVCAALAFTPPTACQASAQAWYHYHQNTLLLHLWSSAAGRATVRWTAIGLSGRPTGRSGQQVAELKLGGNRIVVALGGGKPAPGHRVTIISGSKRSELWANRGAWGAGPPALKVKRQRSGITGAEGLIASKDIQLTRGFAAEIEEAGVGAPGLTIERAFGFGAGRGIRPPHGSALVLIAQGNTGPVQLVLAQRESASLHFYDYFLTLTPHYRRYLIPLSEFRSRSQTRRPLRALHSLAINQLEGTGKAGTRIAIAFVGLGRPGPRITRISGRKDGAEIAVRGASPRAVLRHAARTPSPPQGTTEQALHGGRARLAGRTERRLWLCVRRASGVEQCDPPDAPQTHYLVQPGGSDASLLIDDFITAAPVNAHRQPVTAFASDAETRSKLRLLRKKGTLRLVVALPKQGSYAGFHSDLPPQLPEAALKRYRALELRLRGTLPTRAIELQLVDPRGRGARVNLGQYVSTLSPRWQTVAIPLDAFAAAFRAFGHRGALRRIGRVSLVVGGRHGPLAGSVELDTMRLSSARHPAIVATFDSGDQRINALTGRIGQEAPAGAKLTLTWDVPGAHGKALRVEASQVSPGKNYAIVVFGLGTLPLRNYRQLVFWIRGRDGGEHPNLLLSAGRKRRFKIALADHVQVSQKWQRVAIPLSAFSHKGRTLRDAQQLVFAWEGRQIESEVIELDSIRFE